MIGLLFTEFLEMLEQQYGIAYAETVISNASLQNEGAFTAVGYYSRAEMEQLLESYSLLSGISKNEICYQFGRYLTQTFVLRYPHYYSATSDLFQYLLLLNKRIKTEIGKLYPHVLLPSFKAKLIDSNSLELVYESPNKLSYLIEGFLAGHATYFNEAVTIERKNIESDASIVLFVIKKRQDHD